jgi:single-stranded DNA-binding protein
MSSVLAFDEQAIGAADGFIKGCRVYVEGVLRLDTWEQDGKQRTGLSVMSWHRRLSEIGRHRPKRERKPRGQERRPAAKPNDFHNDEIGF